MKFASPPWPDKTMDQKAGGQSEIQISQAISALSFALDLTEGQPMGHDVRSCMIGIRLAREIGLDKPEIEDLYFALLMKDAGCSSNVSKMFHILERVFDILRQDTPHALDADCVATLLDSTEDHSCDARDRSTVGL